MKYRAWANKSTYLVYNWLRTEGQDEEYQNVGDLYRLAVQEFVEPLTGTARDLMVESINSVNFTEIAELVL